MPHAIDKCLIQRDFFFERILRAMTERQTVPRSGRQVLPRGSHAHDAKSDASLGKFCRHGNFFPAELADERAQEMQRSPQFIEHFKQMSVDLIDNRLIRSPERWSSRR